MFSSLADADFGVANVGRPGTPGEFDGGTRAITYPQVTKDFGSTGAQGNGGAGPQEPVNKGHSAVITVYEACWFNSWNTTFSKDTGVIMESGDVTITDVHDFASVYGEFLATGNDPTIGQLGSIRFQEVSAQNQAGVL